MPESSPYIQRLVEANPLREPLLRSIIQSLSLPSHSHGLDAGCGVGLQTLLLAKAVGTGGHVTGLDLLPELLTYGDDLVAKLGLSERISFKQGDISHLPFENNTFDWAWSADCIGYPAGELGPMLNELMRVVSPGGRIIILGWTSQQLLPGYPLLEAKLNAMSSAYIPFLEDKCPNQQFLRAGHWFRDAGLEAVTVQTVVGCVQAPLTPEERIALASLFEMLWSRQPTVSPEDLELYQHLCQQGAEDFILDIPDYHAFFTYTMFQGITKNH